MSGLLDAIRTGDAARYAELGPKLVVMAAPDFGMPISLKQAQEMFAACALTALSEPRPLEGVRASLVTATMSCGAPWPPGPVSFDFMADSDVAHGVYPGGFQRFYPKAKMGPAPETQP